jgi:hypothetical protein
MNNHEQISRKEYTKPEVVELGRIGEFVQADRASRTLDNVFDDGELVWLTEPRS